jgi:hypothetical protein
MKFSILLVAIAFPMATSKTLRGQTKKTLPNGQTCNFCPDDDNYVWPIEDDNWWGRNGGRDLKEGGKEDHLTDALKIGAQAAKYEAAFLEAAAGKDGLEARHKTRLLAAADAAKYEGSILEAAASGENIDGAHQKRLLKEKMLPNGQTCNFCPDDDNYVWPIEDDDWWKGRDLNEVMDKDINIHRLLKEKTLPNGQTCNFCPDDDDYVWPIEDDNWWGRKGW